MNRTTKIILGLLAGTLLMCLCLTTGGLFFFRTTGWILSSVFEVDNARAQNTSRSIADYTVPDGYGNIYALDTPVFSLVSYTGDDGHSHIYFFQIPTTISIGQEEVERLLEQANVEPDRPDKMQVTGTELVTIRGQEVPLVTSESVNSAGRPYRQVFGSFEGKGGYAVVIISGPIATWDQAAVDRFLASIN